MTIQKNVKYTNDLNSCVYMEIDNNYEIIKASNVEENDKLFKKK